MKALIIGCYPDLTAAPIPLLSRAGFKVDVLWHQEGHADIKNKSLIHKLYRCDTLKELPYLAASTHQSNKYDLVVIGCELALKEVLHSSLDEQEKLSLLPVVAIENYTHLSSKIGFSKLLSSANISTPEFQVIASQAGLISASKKFGYPFFIKIDWSGGGSGVFECDSSDDILKIIENLVFPVLMQRKIEGKTLDLTGFYQNGKLIYFSHSSFEKVLWNKFGPSSLREYTQLGSVDPLIFKELNELGKALGANGFMNTTCIEVQTDKKRYFIEGDMRPTNWVDYGRYIGSDDASKIRDYFLHYKTLEYSSEITHTHPIKLLIPRLNALTFFELISNYQNCWKFRDGEQGVFYYLALIVKQRCNALYSQTIRYFKNISHALLHGDLCRCNALYSQTIRYFKNISHALLHGGLYRFESFVSQHIKPFIPPKIMIKLHSIYRYLRLQE